MRLLSSSKPTNEGEEGRGERPSVASASVARAGEEADGCEERRRRRTRMTEAMCGAGDGRRGLFHGHGRGWRRRVARPETLDKIQGTLNLKVQYKSVSTLSDTARNRLEGGF